MVTDTDTLCVGERERDGLLLWLGDSVALTLPLALREPLALDEPLTPAVGEPASSLVAAGEGLLATEGERRLETVRLGVEEGDPVASRTVRDMVLEVDTDTVTLRVRLPHEDAERERVSLTEGATLGEALGEPLPLALPQGEGDALALPLPDMEPVIVASMLNVPVGAPEAEAATERDRTAVAVVDAEAHRVVLLVNVPVGLTLRERVLVTDTDTLCVGEREREGLLLWLGDNVALTLPLALGEPLPLKVALTLAESVSRLALCEGEGVADPEKLPVTVRVPLAGDTEGEPVARALPEPKRDAEGQAVTLRERVVQGVAEEDPEYVAHAAAPSAIETPPPSAKVHAFGGAAVHAANALPAQSGSEKAATL